MTNEEIALCLSIIKKNTASININRSSIDLHFTLINDIKEENVIFVIDEAIKSLKVSEQRPKGKWIYKMQVMNNPYTYKCSVCKGWEKDKTKYCPNCGAEMEGAE